MPAGWEYRVCVQIVWSWRFPPRDFYAEYSAGMPKSPWISGLTVLCEICRQIVNELRIGRRFPKFSANNEIQLGVILLPPTSLDQGPKTAFHRVLSYIEMPGSFRVKALGNQAQPVRVIRNCFDHIFGIAKTLMFSGDTEGTQKTFGGQRTCVSSLVGEI